MITLTKNQLINLLKTYAEEAFNGGYTAHYIDQNGLEDEDEKPLDTFDKWYRENNATEHLKSKKIIK